MSISAGVRDLPLLDDCAARGDLPPLNGGVRWSVRAGRQENGMRRPECGIAINHIYEAGVARINLVGRAELWQEIVIVWRSCVPGAVRGFGKGAGIADPIDGDKRLAPERPGDGKDAKLPRAPIIRIAIPIFDQVIHGGSAAVGYGWHLGKSEIHRRVAQPTVRERPGRWWNTSTRVQVGLIEGKNGGAIKRKVGWVVV